MAIYYVDSVNGNNERDGLTPETAKKHYFQTIELKHGDTVLFKRGSFFRENLKTEPGITYGSYGEGELPTFNCGTDVSSAEDWVATETENVWECTKPIFGDVGNFVFNENECTAALRWSREELSGQGEFWDSRYGKRTQDTDGTPAEQTVLLYSVGNPAEVYSHIEAVSYGSRFIAQLRNDITFENLRMINIGVHAIGGQGSNVTVRGCVFENIGGCVWSKDLQIRFGNGFEVWEKGDNVLIENCLFKNVYDSCVTHQGPGEKTVPTRNFICRNNIFDTYGMAAFEYRDKMPIDSSFTGNTCLNAGCGFAMLGETLPRKSEIWPQPMGHHIFMWRIDHATEGGNLVIENNYFGPAPVGAAIYSIISPEAEAQVTLDNNKYTENKILLNRWGGENFNDLDAYREKTGQDKGSAYAD